MPERSPGEWQAALLQRHHLEPAYLDTARAWFDPLAAAIAAYQRNSGRPILVALNGCQGSGKTTLSDYLCSALTAEHALGVVSLSLDDFYLTRAERVALASSVHPLLATRGVPGTHDMDLLRHTLAQLLRPCVDEPVTVPRFDKATDDRHPPSAWDTVAEPVQVVVLEGWCLGATPESAAALAAPVNALERNEDAGGLWRGYVNKTLADSFVPLYSLVDQWLMLCAPSFDCVFEWRREQERKLAATVAQEEAVALMGDAALRRFIQHYERLTRQCLAQLPGRVNHLFRLDPERRISDYRHRAGAAPPP